MIYGGRIYDGTSFIFDAIFENYVEAEKNKGLFYPGRYIFVQYSEIAYDQPTRIAIENGTVKNPTGDQERYKQNYDIDQQSYPEKYSQDRIVFRIQWQNGQNNLVQVAQLNSTINTDTVKQEILNNIYVDNNEILHLHLKNEEV